jgi:hypothetical protein
MESEGAPPKVITDDRVGNLVGDFGQGTIDYITGEVYLNTSFTSTTTDVPVIPPPYSNSTEPNKTVYDFTLESRKLTPGSVVVSFHVGDDEEERIVIAKDDGAGALQANPHILRSSINYEAGRFIIEFVTPLTPRSRFEVTATHPVDYLLSDGQEILADYYFTQSTINITEAGLFNSEGKMISYATFPPFEFSSVDYHLNLLFTFRKDKLFNGDKVLHDPDE